MSAQQPHRFTRRTLIGGLLAAGSMTALASCDWLGAIEPVKTPTPLAAATPTPRPSNLPMQQPTPQPMMPVVSGTPDAYLAVAPKVFRVGQTEGVTVSLLRGQQPASGSVSLALVDKAGKTVAQASGTVSGRSSFGLPVGSGPEGDYTLKMAAASFTAESPVKVEDGTLLFVETDKPIYKPGQTLHVRLMTLDPALRPVASTATLELADAKGLKVYKRDVKTDDLGMASVDVPLSTEPNLGVWKATAKAGKRTAQLDVRVERYVLPKYEVTVTLPKSWVLTGDRITGTVAATYSYGKAVKGDLTIKASRYVGTWQEYANVTKAIDGQTTFELPATPYVAGVAGSGGMGNVQLDVTVAEQSTGYEEKTTQLVSVAATPTVLQLIPESVTFKPGLPLNVLVVAQTPDNAPVDADVTLNISYVKKDVSSTSASQKVSVRGGKALAKLTPPSDAISASIYATDAKSKATTSAAFQAGYSPTGSFVHVEQTSPGTVKVGDSASFKVTATKSGGAFYYEVVSRGSVVFSDYTKSQDIQVTVTPQMAPRARLLVYQLTGSSEVAADYVPFDVDGTYPQKVDLAVSADQVKPGDTVEVAVTTEGAARVGLAAVDKSVFILAENRLNLQQVFAELDKLYQTPQAELHSVSGNVSGVGVAVDGPVGVAPEVPIEKQVAPAVRGGIAPMAPQAMGSGALTTRGAKDVFSDAGVVILSNQQVPAGQEFKRESDNFAVPAAAGAARGIAEAAPTPAAAAAPQAEMAKSAVADSTGQLADVQRVRQFFPETWVWDSFSTDASGKATRKLEAPDSITTWMFRAVALSKAAGLGMAEAQLKVLQPFFVQADLPYSVIRGEEFPVQLALYNYGQAAEDFQVDLKGADWFDLLGGATTKVTVQPGNVGAATFRIRPTKLGTNKVEVTARSTKSADAIVKELIVEPEGVAREVVENVVLAPGTKKDLAIDFPDGIVEGSGRAYVALTGNYLTQTINGLEGLLKMPFGCGEQNMILFAPNVFVARYLKETAQMKPEVMVKAESLMMTGYQRELTYRRGDGSFSAFGNQDQSGSLWLTAFVLKTFAQAKDLIYVDDAVLSTGRAWIAKYQKSDGSFEPVGFVHHQELLGGLQGTPALTAFVAVALNEAGETSAFGKAIRYLEGTVDNASAYALALGAYALGLAKSSKAKAAVARLMTMAKETDEGLHWGDDAQPVDTSQSGGKEIMPPIGRPGQSAAIETTGYALLALLVAGDKLNASRAARWLVSRRNAYGGFGSTQDTVVGLQALTQYASDSRSDVDATVTLKAGNWGKAAAVSPTNADVLQTIEVPVGGKALTVEAAGKGQVVLQTVRRYNVPAEDKPATPIFDLKVDYTADRIEVDDLITVAARIKYTPPLPLAAGMVVLDVAVPTGFAPETSSIDAAVKQQPKLKRYDVSGRKVVFYIEDMQPGEQLSITFKARALYPVKAQAVTSQVYSYYRTDWRGESLGGALVVGG